VSNGEMIANGFEDGQIEARVEGQRAMFLLLAAGWKGALDRLIRGYPLPDSRKPTNGCRPIGANEWART
jgi:hypothetical protein